MEPDLAKQLNCPICLHIPEKEIYQCKNGHTICAHCSSKVIQCPQCRVRYGSDKIRCRAVESLLDSMTFSCPNEPSGCTQEKLKREDIGQHLTNCAFGITKAGNSSAREPPIGNDDGNETPISETSSDEDEELSDSDDDDFDGNPLSRSGLDLVPNVDGLRPLGDLTPLAATSTTYKNILKYIRNGSDLPNSGLDLKIHNIFSIESTSCVRATTPDSTSMLLWFKTTPASVSKLAVGQDGCISFYDRLARAVATNPKEIRQPPLRQMVLLFSVNLGREYDSPHKYLHWRNRTLPQGYDSVKTTGKFIPDSDASSEDNSAKIPLGKTKENDAFPSYEADYNEYIIYHISRAKLRYAVDVEFVRCEGAPPENEDDDDDEVEDDEEDEEDEAEVDAEEDHEEDDDVEVQELETEGVRFALELVEDSETEESADEQDLDHN